MGKQTSSRRDFLRLSTMAALGTTSLAALADQVVKPTPGADTDLEIFIFSKHLQFLDYKNMSEAAKEMGFDGIDLTVRPGGHVLPERVSDDLPAATQAMAAVGFSPRLLTTRVLDAEDPLDRKVVATASGLGYDLYRTGWWRIYDDTDIKEVARLAQERLHGLAQLSQELGIGGTYENHSGNFFGASIWALDLALEGLSSEHMGCQYDIQHAIVEGGRSWPIELRLIKDNINSLVVKDFKWIKEGGAWKTARVPIGEGMIDFVKFFSLLKKYGIKVPVILHCEYDLGGAEKGGTPSINHKLVFSRLQKDLLLIRDAWRRAG